MNIKEMPPYGRVVRLIKHPENRSWISAHAKVGMLGVVVDTAPGLWDLTVYWPLDEYQGEPTDNCGGSTWQSFYVTKDMIEAVLDGECIVSMKIEATGQQIGFVGQQPEPVNTQLTFPTNRLPLVIDLVGYLKSCPPLDIVQLPETLFPYVR